MKLNCNLSEGEECIDWRSSFIGTDLSEGLKSKYTLKIFPLEDLEQIHPNEAEYATAIPSAI